MSKFLDTSGLQTLWGLIKGNFIAKSSVSAKSTTLSFGAESEIAEIDGKKIKVTLPTNPNTNTARLQVSDTSNKRINTLESTGSYIQFQAGTNKFTVSDGTNSFDVGITPSISLAHTITVISGVKKDGSTNISATSTSATNPSVTLGDSGASAGAYGPTGDVSGVEGATIKIPYIRVNSKGIVTEISEQTLTTHNSTYNVYNGSFKIKTQAGSSAAVEVAGTSANTSNNSDVTFVQGGNITITPNATSRTITIAATDTTYSAGTYLALNGTQFYHKTSGVSAGSYGPTGDVQGNNGATISVPQIKVDAQGHITSISNKTFTAVNSTYTVNNGSFEIKTKVGNNAAVSVSSTSANTASNSSITFIQGGNISLTSDTTNKTITIAATDTTYTAGTYLSLSGTQFSHKNSGAAAGTYGPSADVSGSNGATISVPQIKVDAQGHITEISNKTFTAVDHTYTVNNGSFTIKTKVGSNAAVSVGSTSANASGNTDVTFIQGTNVSLTSDTTNRTITIAATDTTYTAGTYLELSGTQFKHKNSGVTANSYGPTGDVTGSEGATIKVPQITVDAQGHITGVTERTYTSKNSTYTVNNGTYSVKMKSGDTTTTISDFTANQSGTDDITFIKGANITLTGDTTNRTITIAATDTTYTAGTGLTLSGTQFKHSNSVTAGTAGTSSATSGSTLAVPYITYDAQGHITATGTHTHTITGFLTSHQTLTNHAKLADTSTVGQAIVSKSGGYEWKTLGGAAYKSVDADTMTSSSTNLPTAKAVAAFVSSALTSVLTYKGTIGSSGADITALPASHKVGDTYVVKVAGTFAGQACEVGDYIICKTAGSSANDAHWDVINGENQVENKSASLAAAGSSATIATVDGTNLTITTPNSWTGVTKTGTITKVGNTSSGDVSVSSSNNTASWGNAVTVGSVGGVDLKFTMPGNPNSNTTYTFASGTTKGAFQVTPSGGSAQTVNIYGLGTAAYTNSDAYATAGHTHSYLPLAGGTMNDTAVISRKGVSVSWVNGRNNPIIKTTEYNGYNAILSMKTTSGSWDLGVYSDDKAYLTYITDANHSAGQNNTTYQLVFPKSNGTIALTSQIPTVNNGTLHLQASGTDVKTFTANQSGDTTLNIATGSGNGTISVGGTDVAVKGLGSAAYTNSNAYAAASHSHSYVPSSNSSSIGLDPGSNYIGYVGSLTKAAWNYNQTDGAMYTQFYSASWKHEIYADYRTGHMSVRGKNNGTWQNWYSVFDMGNVTAGTNVSISQNSTTGQITISSSYSNTAKLKVSDTTNKRIANTENTGNYVQFTGGSNKFTVSDGTNSFEVPITISGYATSGHTHTTSIAADSGSSALNMAANTTYKLTAGGTTFIFKTPADSNTWRPVGTGASDAAAGNHTHTTSIATSSGTSQLTLAFGTKYVITAGGTSYVFTMPGNPNTNTWRPIQVGGADKLTDSSSKINFTGGGSASVSYASGTITISCSAAANATADSALSQSEIAAILV